MSRRKLVLSFFCFLASYFTISLFPFLSPPCLSMPLRPDILDSLRAQGKLEDEGRIMREAYDRGVNHPPKLRPVIEAPLPGLRVQVESSALMREKKAIVILVDFSDNVANTTAYPSSHYSDLLFSTGTYPTGSMRDYLTESSYGQLGIVGSVTEWLRMPQTYAYYVNGQRGLGVYPYNAQRLAQDAVAAANPYVDFSQFDNDGPDGIPSSGDDDGYVDAVFIVHAGPGYEETHNSNHIHSHQWTTRTPVTVDGVKVSVYSMEPDNGKIGVFCHEFGHVLGLPDLYDYDYDARGVGNWSVMGYGSWGNNGLTPTHFDAWSKSKLGFVTPTVLTANVDSVTVPNAETSPTSYIVWTNGIYSNEYFLVENRRPILFDSSLLGSGLVIYHVDEDALNNRNQCCCSPCQLHYAVAVEQADAECDLESNYNSGDQGDPFPGSGGMMNPNYVFNYLSTPSSRSYSGNDTQVAFTNIITIGNTVQMDVTVETLPAIDVLAKPVSDSVALGSGDADGIIDPGETLDLPFVLNNYGAEAESVRAGIHTSDSFVTLLVDTSTYGAMGSDEAKLAEPPFRFSVSPSCPVPHGIIFDMNISAGSEYTVSRRCFVGVQDTLRFYDWTHSSGRRGYKDQWHISTEKNHTAGDMSCWKCGSTILDNYASKLDASLYTVAFGVTASTELTFWYWMEAETYSSTSAWDGGVVEISANGGPWQVITPVGGYPYTIKSSLDSPYPAGTPCYSGISTVWKYQRFVLSGYTGSARLRFRFGTDAAIVYRGWYIDDVALVNAEVISAPLPGTPEASAGIVAAYPNPFNPLTTIKFSVAKETRPVRISIYDVSGRLVQKLVEEALPPGLYAVTWDGKDRRGRQVASGAYLCRMEAGPTSQTIKLVLLR